MAIKSKPRRYRECISGHTIGIASGHGERIHDFLKGWGTISKDGKSILWDWWRPLPKRLREQRLRTHERWVKKGCPITIPNWLSDLVRDGLNLKEIMSVQPMTATLNTPVFPMDFTYSVSGSKKSS